MKELAADPGAQIGADHTRYLRILALIDDYVSEAAYCLSDYGDGPALVKALATAEAPTDGRRSIWLARWDGAR